MHARMTTLQLEPDKIDAAVAGLEQNDVPKWKELDGFKGFTLLVDRSTGKVVGTTYWESEEALRASEDASASARASAAETGGASSEAQVERFEVAVDTES